MRIRVLTMIALMILPAGLTAQAGVRPPRTGRGTEPQPAPLPPTIGPVGQALAYKRARWSAEGYSLINSIQAPTATGGISRSTMVGAGTRADYRFSDNFSATVDMTSSIPGGATTAQTIEVGTRYSPLAWDRVIRPFADLRAGYVNMYDTFATDPAASTAGGADQQLTGGTRYSRGFGGGAGAGVEYSFTPTLALTTELLAMRNRMNAYRATGPATLPSNSAYSMTSFRYTLGVRFNPVSALHSVQKSAP